LNVLVCMIYMFAFRTKLAAPQRPNVTLCDNCQYEKENKERNNVKRKQMRTNAKKTKPTAIYMSYDQGQGPVKNLRFHSDLTDSENRRRESKFVKKLVTR